MILAAYQSRYMPQLHYFNRIAASDIFVILDDVQYSRGDYTNRTLIEGNKFLTVPVITKMEPINQILIDKANFNVNKHLRILIYAYQKQPYFKEYFPRIKEIITSGYDKIIDLNNVLLKYFIDLLELKTKIVFSSELAVKSTKSQRLIDISKMLGADSYLSGAVAIEKYLDLELFKSNGIRVLRQNWQSPVENFSVIDSLFKRGCAETKRIILEIQYDFVDCK